MTKQWWKESVIYQIYPRSFCDSNGDGIGDLKGVTSKLDYLEELGIDVIWLSPIYQSPNDDNGYDISDYEAIMDEFGSMQDFDEMLMEAHKRGIKIVMDLVVNHTSDEHKWFVESRGSVDNPKRDYYIWKKSKNGKEPNNWGSCFSGSAWELDETTGMYYLHCFSKKQPDLNWENEKVRQEIFDMMTKWCDKGIDGFRMDVISMISKPKGMPDGQVMENSTYGEPMSVCNGPHVHEYLQEMNQKVLSKYDIMTVGECAGVTIEEAKKYANSDGTELNMVFQFEHVGVDVDGNGKWCNKPFDLPKLKKVMAKWQTELYDVAWNSIFFSNHDQPRIVSRLGNDSDKYRECSAKCIATMLHMMQGTPYVYQGEELGMTNTEFKSVDDFNDIEAINAYHELKKMHIFSEEELMARISYKNRDNARTPMQWDDEENAGFTTGTPWLALNNNYLKINAKQEQNNSNSVFRYYQKLIALRKNNPIVVYGKFELLMPEDRCIFSYTRTYSNERLLVACNFSDEPQRYQIPEEYNIEKAAILIENMGELQDEILKPYQTIVWHWI